MITTVTLNASIDKAYFMTRKIENGTVMRVAETHNSAGGKGLNVARVARLCGSDTKAAGLVGGYNGQYLEALLDADGISYEFEHIDGETRSCINILDPEYGSTEYLEPGCQVTSEEEAAFLDRFPELIRDSDVVTISGSAPRGMGRDIYQKMIRIVKSLGKRVILDTSGEYLKRGLESLPTMVKPNKDEIEMLFDIKVSSQEDVIEYAKKIHEKGIPYVVISLGRDGALLVCEKGLYLGRPPKIEAVNTVGCGDSMVGALAVGLERHMEPEEALKFAVAVASANALSPHTGTFDTAKRDELIENVKIIKLEDPERK
ncbi:1-phosphofructokinase [Anaerostipes sp.]|uniref:1-phosphofructokinase n=1 Tax=Anaerostipes sp. TaxID=1872530 RepID=UPI0025C2CF85|nr:1-phosphofructokinase [Anaerostipes sp.]MBS7009151.1 1-phosphofructokinase [Anaerostipes sp.]